MAGKNCVAIASDKRLGQQFTTLGMDFPKISVIHPKLYLGIGGLASDVLTLQDDFKLKHNLYKLRENKLMEPETFAHLLSSTLYQRRFAPYFVDPVIAGLNKKNEPFICGTDLIGCIGWSKDFVVGGTAATQLFGMCESLWEPDLEPEALLEVTSQALMNAFDRDAYSGWGAVIHVLTPEKVITKHLKTRMD